MQTMSCEEEEKIQRYGFFFFFFLNILITLFQFYLKIYICALVK